MPVDDEARSLLALLATQDEVLSGKGQYALYRRNDTIHRTPLQGKLVFSSFAS